MVPFEDLDDVTLAIEDTDEMKKTVKMKRLKERKKMNKMKEMKAGRLVCYGLNVQTFNLSWKKGR